MDPPDPLPPPDEPTKPQNEPPSVELEGKKKPCPSFDETRTSHEVDASRASESAEDARDWSRKLRTTSEHVGERSEQGEQENSPGRAPGEPGSETAVPGEPQDHQRSLEDDGKRRDDATNASCRDRRPGGQVELQEASSAIGIPKRLSKTPITMGYTPGATRTSASSKRTRYVELEVQRAQRVTWR